jgi:PKD repeat protein
MPNDIHRKMTSRETIAVFVCLGIAFASPATFGAEDYSQWKYSCIITLNTVASGANIPTSQNGFPVLVKLTRATNTFSFAQAQKNGNDIRFAKSDGITRLPYQIERWDSANQVAELWVKVDVKGNDNVQNISMLWGNAVAADSQNSKAVFSTDNGFVGVYHLSENGVGTRYNSAQNAYNGTTKNYEGTNEKRAGPWGVGDSLETDDGIVLGDIDFAKNLTLSAWVMPHGFISNGKIINKEWSVPALPWQAYTLQYTTANPANAEMRLAVGGVAQATQTATTLTNYQWGYVAGAYDGTTIQTYQNGVASGSPIIAPGTVSNTDKNTTIGYPEGGDPAQRFNGIVKEVRLENEPRSSDWIKLCYESQKPNADWLTFSPRLFAPIILKQPVSNETILGRPETLTVVASGTPPLQFQWRKDGATINGGAFATYIILDVKPADAGAYDVMVTNSQGSVTSNSANLKVVLPAQASFTVSDSIARVPVTIRFTDQSTGGFTKRIWDFGDNTQDSSNSATPQHLYGAPGTYKVKLVLLNGTARVDSFTIAIKSYTENPISIQGKYVSTGKAEITFSNYASIPTSFPPPYADSVKLWFLSGVIPESDVGALVCGQYSLVTMKKSSSFFTDEVTVSLTGTTSVAGFMTQIHWNNGSWQWSPFNAVNGAIVLMRDTIAPVNTASVSGRYISGDSVVFTVRALNTIDTSKVDSFAVWWSTGTVDSIPNLSGPANIRWFNLKDRSPVFNLTGGSDSFFVVNPSFNTGLEKKVFCSIVLKGKNDVTSGWIKASFLVGKSRPLNPVKLWAVLPSAGTITLKWNHVVGIGKIRIWYRANSAVPVNWDNFSAVEFVLLDVPVVSDTEYIVTGLQPQTTYYFGAQVYDYEKGLWSYVTDSSIASARTIAARYPKLDSNSVKITSMTFDTVKNQIKVAWNVALLPETLEVGMSYSLTSYPIVDIGDQQVIRVAAGSGEAIVKLREPLVYDTMYYVSLWERRLEGQWANPTEDSKAKVRSPYFNWQSVTYFQKVPGDTNFVFNNNILIITDKVKEPNPITGTIRLFPVARENLDGFIAVGLPFYFSDKDPSGNFKISVKTTIPTGRRESDVRIYQLKSGMWNVDRTTKPEGNGYVSIYTNDLEYPFLALIDTQRVSLTRGPHADTLDAGIDMVDMLYIHDNSGNVTWQYSYAKGGDAFTPNFTSQGMLEGKDATIPITIRGVAISPDNGLRAMIVVSDGAHTDTSDVSRQVIRVDKSDFVSTEANKWAPLRVTAELADRDIRAVLKDDPANPAWTYDTKKMRLFRWLPEIDAQAGLKWTEFSDNVAALFFLKPGMLVWLKTKESKTVNFGRGITPSLKTSYGIPLAAGNWTDFALPFKFDINIGDIIDSTGVVADSLQFYTWENDFASGRYVSVAAFINALSSAGLANLGWKLSSKDFKGFTVYNPTKTPVLLRIPPIPETMSKYEVLKKTTGNGWAVAVNVKTADGSRCGTVYCGYTKEQNGAAKSFFPIAPSFARIYAGVYDAPANKLYGHAVFRAMDGGGCSFIIAFVNESDQQERVLYRLDNLGSLAPGMTAKMYNETTGSYDDWSRGEAFADVEPGSRVLRRLIVGNEAYLAKTTESLRIGKLALIGISPNPFRSFIRIRYSVPAGGVDCLSFSIFDLRGRTVWQHSAGAGASPGIKDLLWDGASFDRRKVAAGIYVVRMTAFDAARKPFCEFEKKMTYLP